MRNKEQILEVSIVLQQVLLQARKFLKFAEQQYFGLRTDRTKYTKVNWSKVMTSFWKEKDKSTSGKRKH